MTNEEKAKDKLKEVYEGQCRTAFTGIVTIWTETNHGAVRIPIDDLFSNFSDKKVRVTVEEID